MYQAIYKNIEGTHGMFGNIEASPVWTIYAPTSRGSTVEDVNQMRDPLVPQWSGRKIDIWTQNWNAKNVIHSCNYFDQNPFVFAPVSGIWLMPRNNAALWVCHPWHLPILYLRFLVSYFVFKDFPTRASETCWSKSKTTQMTVMFNLTQSRQTTS